MNVQSRVLHEAHSEAVSPGGTVYGRTEPLSLSITGVKSSSKPSASLASAPLSRRSMRLKTIGHTPDHGVQASTSVLQLLYAMLNILKYCCFSVSEQFS